MLHDDIERRRRIEELEVLTNDASDNALLWHHLGAYRALQGDHAGAMDAYDRAIAIKSDYVSAHQNRCIALLSIGNQQVQSSDFHKAIDSYELALPAADDEIASDLHYNIGIAKYNLRDWPGAIQAFNKSREMRPEKSRDALINLGASKCSNGNPEWALSDYEEALHLGPDDPDLLNNIGVSNAKLARSEESLDRLRGALSLFERSIILDDMHEQAEHNKRICLQRLSQYDDAPEDLEKDPVANDSPDSVETFLGTLGPLPLDALTELRLAEREFYNRDRDQWYHVSAMHYSNAAETLLRGLLFPAINGNAYLREHIQRNPFLFRDFTELLTRMADDTRIKESNRGFANKSKIRELRGLIWEISGTKGGRQLAHGDTESKPVTVDATRSCLLGTFVNPDGPRGILELIRLLVNT